jgi:hypothetical protein
MFDKVNISISKKGIPQIFKPQKSNLPLGDPPARKRAPHETEDGAVSPPSMWVYLVVSDSEQVFFFVFFRGDNADEKVTGDLTYKGRGPCHVGVSISTNGTLSI